jgi:hypothetical protein
MLAGFTKSGYGKGLVDARRDAGGIGLPVAPIHGLPLRHVKAAGPEQRLHHELVHARRRREDPTPDVGDVRQFEKALNRAVFAQRAVQHREHHIHAESGQRQPRRLVVAIRRPIEHHHRLVAGPRGQQHFTTAADARAFVARLLDHFRRRRG